MSKLNRVFIGNLFFFFCMGALVAQTYPPTETNPAGILQSPGLIIAAVVAIYEVIVRIVPTVKKWSFLGKIIDFLKMGSDKLNKVKAPPRK
jgi:hypothetical protein